MFNILNTYKYKSLSHTSLTTINGGRLRKRYRCGLGIVGGALSASEGGAPGIFAGAIIGAASSC